MSSAGVASRAAVPASGARAEASRRNGAKSRGPKTPEGKSRSAQNALKHGLRAQKHVVLPDEDAAGFAALEAALGDELAPQGVLQRILVGRIARAAWRLDRAERLEVDLFAERLLSVPADGGPGLALIRDGNGTRSFETLLRYRGAAMAELMRSLRMLKVLQAEAPVPIEQAAGAARALPRAARAAPAAIARPGPNEPERRLTSEYATSGQPSPAALHELAPRWTPDQPEPGRDRHEGPGAVCPLREPAPLSKSNEPENSQESAAESESVSRRDHENSAPHRTRPGHG